MTAIRKNARAVWLTGWLVLGCADAEPGDMTRATTGKLPEGVVALVGAEQVAAQTIARISRAQDLGPRAARELAVRDALFAAGARADLGGYGLVRSAERSAFARALLQQLKREAHRTPVTDTEVAEATARNWVKLDRPVSVRTCHAVAKVKEPGQDAVARGVAERIAISVQDAKTCKEFMRRAKAVPTGKVGVKVEKLPPVTIDGRVVRLNAPPGARTSTFDPDFAKAAHALQAPGDQSPVAKSKSGYHVILLEARLDEERLPLAERRKVLRSEIMDTRVKRLEEEVLERTRQRSSVQVLRTATDLTGRVRVKR